MNPSAQNPTQLSPAQQLQELQQAIQQMRAELAQSQNMTQQVTQALTTANQNNAALQARLQAQSSVQSPQVKLKKPDSYKGKGSISSWVVHMDNYTRSSSPEHAFLIAVSFLEGNAHEWWIVHSLTEEGRNIVTWQGLKEALIKRFQPLNKTKMARDKLAKWKQVRDVSSFNEDFLRILLDIPNISEEEKIDRYTRALKPYVWKEMCTKDYGELSEAMADAERIEEAHRRIGTRNLRTNISSRPSRSPNTPSGSGVAPMELGNARVKRLSPAEKSLCIREGLCFRCQEKGHRARYCPKGQRS